VVLVVGSIMGGFGVFLILWVWRSPLAPPEEKLC
jgi:hypothetical protein